MDRMKRVLCKIYVLDMLKAREALEVEVEVEVEFEVFLSPSLEVELSPYSCRSGCKCSRKNCTVETKHRRNPDNKL